MLSGVVHRDADGTFWFDDRPVRGSNEIPSTPAWRGTLWYAAPGIRPSDWAALLRPGDTAFGPGPGEVAGVVLQVRNRGTIRILDARCWGVLEPDPEACLRQLVAVQDQATGCELKLKSSAASTALAFYLEQFDGQDGRLKLKQLPCRWRGFAHAAMHAGPVAVLKGGASFAAHLDVKKAYLAALQQPLPVYGTRGENGEKVGGWFTHDDARWGVIRKLTGFVDVAVTVHGDARDPAGLPPLPVHAAWGTIYPKGKLRGVWTISAVREAEERGEVTIDNVFQFCFAPVCEPIFAELAAAFERLPNPLGKRLYTRFWGKLGSRGGFNAVKSEQPILGAVPAAGLWWEFSGTDPWSPKARPTYRPDIAAFVLAHNQANMFTAMRKLEPGSLVATHVDALWTTDIEGAGRIAAEASGAIGGLRIKRVGPLRTYGVGMYTHGERFACSGYDRRLHGPLTKERLEAFVAGNTQEMERRFLMHARTWASDPATDPAATSVPLVVQMDASESTIEGPAVESADWTQGGWYRRAAEMAPVVSKDADVNSRDDSERLAAK